MTKNLLNSIIGKPQAAFLASLVILSCQISESHAKPNQEPIPAKLLRYAERIVSRYDANEDGALEESEWRQMHGEAQAADADGDGEITAEEFARHVLEFARHRRVRIPMPAPSAAEEKSEKPAEPAKAEAEEKQPAGPTETVQADEGASDADLEALLGGDDVPRKKFFVPAHRLPAGLPSWFLERDQDGDAQLELREFAPKPTPSDLQEFRRYDLNGDGLITAGECARTAKPSKTGRP